MQKYLILQGPQKAINSPNLELDLWITLLEKESYIIFRSFQSLGSLFCMLPMLYPIICEMKIILKSLPKSFELKVAYANIFKRFKNFKYISHDSSIGLRLIFWGPSKNLLDFFYSLKNMGNENSAYKFYKIVSRRNLGLKDLWVSL